MSAVRFLRLPGCDLPLPAYATSGAAGMDIRACLPGGPLRLEPGAIAMVPTGFRIALPPGTEMQVRPRSGLASRHGVSLPNSPGTIDEDYRGELIVPLINLGREAVVIAHGDRIAQGVVGRVAQWPVAEVEGLEETARGAGGFGSTGV